MKIAWNNKKKDFFAIAISLIIASFFSNYTTCLIVGVVSYITLRYIQVTFFSRGEVYDENDRI
tara:strand:+ start:501 stop:689 length:189 start_codon:yes stop_codon:yes gene_type:complete